LWRESAVGQGGESGVEVVCLGGIVSDACTRSVEARLEERSRVVRVLEDVWNGEPGRPVLLVSPGLGGFDSLLDEVEELGFNPFLLEATGVPETMLSGMSLESVIGFHVGFIEATVEERRGARRVQPRVTRREALRRLFLVTPRYRVLPRLRDPGRCGGGVCPYSALGPRGVDEARCRGCMVCAWRCPDAVEPPAWTGPLGMLYAYRFVSEHGLDGVLFICRRMLGRLDEAAVEASPARLLSFHVPCVSWLYPQLVRVLRERLGVYVHVYYDADACRGCELGEAADAAAEALRGSGAVVSASLVEASAHAFTGYARPALSLEEAVEAMLEALGLDAATAAGGGSGASAR